MTGRSDRSVAIVCTLVSVAAALLAIVISIEPRGWDITALVRVATDDKIASAIRGWDPDFAFTSPRSHYDGLFNYVIALDPFARGSFHLLIDNPAYRYGHPGYGWLAGALSFGQVDWVPWTLALVNVAATGVAAFAVSRLARLFGWTPWAGLLIALTPGIVLANSIDTSEPLTVALLSLALLAWFQRRRERAALLFLALCLVDEPSVMVPVALGVWEVIRRIRGVTSERLLPVVAYLVPGPVAFFAWYMYLRFTFGALPSAQTATAFSFPFVGWWQTLQTAGGHLDGAHLQTQLALSAISILVVTGVIFVVSVVAAWRLRTVWDVIFLQAAVLVMLLNWTSFFYVKDYVRSLNIFLLLLPTVLVLPRRVPLAIAGDRDDHHDVSEPSKWESDVVNASGGAQGAP